MMNSLFFLLALLHTGASATIVGGKGPLLNLTITGTILPSNSLEATSVEVVPGVYEVTAMTTSQGVGVVATRHLLVVDRLGVLKNQPVVLSFEDNAIGVQMPNTLVYAYEWPKGLSRTRVVTLFKKTPMKAVARLNLKPVVGG